MLGLRCRPCPSSIQPCSLDHLQCPTAVPPPATVPSNGWENVVTVDASTAPPAACHCTVEALWSLWVPAGWLGRPPIPHGATRPCQVKIPRLHAFPPRITNCPIQQTRLGHPRVWSLYEVPPHRRRPATAVGPARTVPEYHCSISLSCTPSRPWRWTLGSALACARAVSAATFSGQATCPTIKLQRPAALQPAGSA